MSDPVSPTLFSSALSKETGATVYVKAEIYSATKSYKDRMATSAVQEALRAGATRAVVTSSGNQGIAIAHAARTAGLPCLVIATKHILPVYRDTLQNLGAALQIVPDMQARSELFHQRIAEGYFPLSVVAADRGKKVQAGKSGYSAIAREIVDALGAAPDFLILPVCFGDGSSGILRGFQEMARERGTRIPKFLMVRARSTEEKVAFSITSDITTPEVASTIEATGGSWMYFNNEEFLEAQRLGREQGLDLEPAAAGPFLALRKWAAESPGIPQGSSIVLLLTAANRE